jgi:ABC-type multidrug transport system ATPase subunit
VPKTGCCGRRKGDLEPKVILDNVSGSALPGQFLSIIGASGAGKTTLLNYLSGRLISQNLEKSGEVLVNGVNRD